MAIMTTHKWSAILYCWPLQLREAKNRDLRDTLFVWAILPRKLFLVPLPNQFPWFDWLAWLSLKCQERLWAQWWISPKHSRVLIFKVLWCKNACAESIINLGVDIFFVRLSFPDMICLIIVSLNILLSNMKACLWENGDRISLIHPPNPTSKRLQILWSFFAERLYQIPSFPDLPSKKTASVGALKIGSVRSTCVNRTWSVLVCLHIQYVANPVWAILCDLIHCEVCTMFL